MSFLPKKCINKNICAMSNKSLLFISDNYVADYIGTFFLNYLSVSLHNKDVICEKEFVNGALVLRFYGSEIPGPDEIRAEVKLTVYADVSDPILVISSVGQFDLFLKLSLAPEVRYEFFDEYFCYLRKRPCLKLIKKEVPLYFFGDGSVKIDSDNMLLQIRPGYSRIFVCTPDDVESIYCYKNIFKRAFVNAIFSDTPQDMIYRKFLRKRDEHIWNTSLENIIRHVPIELHKLIYQTRENCYYFQGESGGFWWKNAKIQISEMCDVFHFLIAIKERRMAKLFAEFIYCLIEGFSDIPLSASYNVDEFFLSVNTFNHSAVSAYMALYEYEKVFRIPHDKRLDELADIIIDNFSRLVKGGMLPFSGLEKCFTDGRLKPSQRFEGSSEATIKFIAFANKFLLSVKKKTAKVEKLEKLVNFSAAKFLDNFYYQKAILLNSPKRLNKITLPHKITGLCDACGAASSLTHFKGSYYCTSCDQNTAIIDMPSEKIYEFDDAVLLEKYLRACIFGKNTVFKEVIPENLSLDGLIMSIKCYRYNDLLQAKFLDKMIERCNKNRENLEFNKLCRILADIILYTKK